MDKPTKTANGKASGYASDLKYLGKLMPKSSYFITTWHEIPERMVCLADTPDEQMYCSKYVPATKEEIFEECPTAEDFSCRFCECGCSNLCTV